jgi:hypothetical protein
MSKQNMFVQNLADALIKLKVMAETEAQSLVKEFQGRTKGRIDDFLLDEGIIDRETLLKAFQQIYAIPASDVRGYFFNHQILLLFPRDFLIQKAVIPMDIEGDILTIVVSDPEDEETMSTIGNYVPYNVSVSVGIRRDIIDAIEEYYDEDLATADMHEQDNDVQETDEDDSDVVDYI